MSEPGVAPRHAKLRLIGAFRLADGGGAVTAIPNRRARGLLAYLALAPERRAARDRLGGLLWSDRGEPQARASLRQCLLALRDILDAAGLDLIDRGREDVALRAGAVGIDVDAVLSTIETARAEDLAGVIAALGSERLLDDLDIIGLFRDWREQARAQFDQSIARAVLRRLEAMTADRDWRSAAAVAEAYLRRDPLDEAVVAAAIRADVALGATSAAHRRFELLRAGLAKEFGAAPGPLAREALALASSAARAAAVQAAAPPERPPAANPAPARPPPIAPFAPLVIVALFDPGDAGEAGSGLAANLRDEVLSGLSRFNDLRVLNDPRALEVILAEQASEPPPDAGPDPLPARAAYVLGASLRAAHDGQRLIVQLLAAEERRVIWADRFALPPAGMVRETDATIARIVAAVLPTIDADLSRRSTGGSDDQALARELLARGVDARARTFAAARAAADALEAIVAADPGSARALLPLAYLYNTDFGYTRAGSSGPAEQARALELTKAALAIDRTNVHAYTSTAWCYLRRRQWMPAKLHFDQALALNPLHVRRLMEIGYGFLMLDEREAARALLDRCLALNPAPRDGYFADLGLLCLIHGDHAQAETYFELGADPEIWSGIYTAINAQMGGWPSPAKARAAVASVRSIWPDSRPLTTEAVVAWIASHHPFRSAEVEGRFLDAAARAFAHL